MSTDTSSLPTRTVATPAAGGALPQIEQFLARLARTVQRHRNYAPGNPLCGKATAAAHEALVGLTDEQLLLRVTPHAMLLPDNTAVGELPLIHTELTRRLHRAAVGSLSIFRNASQWELSRFCRALLEHHADAAAEPLGDLLRRLGVEHVEVTTVPQPAVLEVGAPTDARLACVADQQDWRAADLEARGAGGHLYPANKGWVRLDPACTLHSVSLGDLALLVEDPMQLANMLVQLADDQASATPEDAFEQHLEQITQLLRSLSPSLVQPMFSRVAQALLSLDDGRRKHLLKTMLVPGLLDGRFDGALLRHLPDLEMADALAALADVQLAAPELMAFALDRLGLPSERRTRIESLVLESTAVSARDADPDAVKPGRIDGYAEGRIHVDHTDAKSFGDFATFDMAVTDTDAAGLRRIQQRVAASSFRGEQARCLLNLLRMEGNPGAAAGLIERAVSVLHDFERTESWDEFAFWIGSYRRLGESVEPERPEIASLVDTMVTGHASAGLIQALMNFATNDERRETAALVLEGFGNTAALPIVAVLTEEPSRTRRRLLLGIMSLRAPAIAAGLVQHLENPFWFVVRNLLCTLAHGGGGYESAVAACTTHRDERVAREAFRALAQIGTADALAHVTAALVANRRTSRLALDALWRFPPPLARTGAKTFLGSTDLVLRRPSLARRLLQQLAASGTSDLRSVLDGLKPLRTRFWSPGAMRVGLTASALARQS